MEYLICSECRTVHGRVGERRGKGSLLFENFDIAERMFTQFPRRFCKLRDKTTKMIIVPRMSQKALENAFSLARRLQKMNVA
jgi:hypothetical protein